MDGASLSGCRQRSSASGSTTDKQVSWSSQTERLAHLIILLRERVRFSEAQADEAVPTPEARFLSRGWHHWLQDRVSPAVLAQGIAAKRYDLDRDKVNATTFHLRKKILPQVAHKSHSIATLLVFCIARKRVNQIAYIKKHYDA